MKANRKLALMMAVLAVALGLCSCAQDVQRNDGLCTVTFSAGRSRDVLANIAYPEPMSQTWTLVAEKKDDGSATGAGSYDGVLLTDGFGPFSTGKWTFTLISSEYRGEVTTILGEGANTVSVDLSLQSGDGNIRLVGCNAPQTESGFTFSRAEVVMDGNVLFSLDRSVSSLVDGKWRFARMESCASPGIHDMEVRVMDSSKNVYRTETFKLRVEPRVTTELSFGVFEGSADFTVNLDRKEGIAE